MANINMAQMTRPNFIEETAAKIERGGIGFANLGESSAEAARVIDELSGGINNDLVTVQKGAAFQVGQIGDEGVALAVRLPDEVLSEAERVGGSLGRELVERSSAQRQVGLLQGAIHRGVEDPGFFDRIRDAFRTARPSDEIAGTSTAIARRFRDMDLMERMKFLKPKAYKVGFGVAALSAGYYLARRGQKQELYEETMQEQDFESGPLSIKEFNDIDQQMAMQTSSRRDPLVTAGVVGNLDRNKTSHYKMGPNKYNHLFGG